jgi:hypothetical protein
LTSGLWWHCPSLHPQWLRKISETEFMLVTQTKIQTEQFWNTWHQRNIYSPHQPPFPYLNTIPILHEGYLLRVPQITNRYFIKRVYLVIFLISFYRMWWLDAIFRVVRIVFILWIVYNSAVVQNALLSIYTNVMDNRHADITHNLLPSQHKRWSESHAAIRLIYFPQNSGTFQSSLTLNSITATDANDWILL